MNKQLKVARLVEHSVYGTNSTGQVTAHSTVFEKMAAVSVQLKSLETGRSSKWRQ